MPAPCQGCGERDDRCRCDGPQGFGEDMETGFHLWDPEDEEYEET